MKATDLLKKQHKEVKTLFKKIEDAEGARERRQLMDEIGTALEGHTLIEEEMFRSTTWSSSSWPSCPRSTPRTSGSRPR